MSAPIWLLLTAGTGRGLAKMMTARVGAGVYGQAVVRVDVAGGGPELCRSATVAAKETARILYRERYLDREIVVNFAAAESAAEGFGNVLGRSAELAFALALTAAVLDRDFPAIAATGIIEEGGAIRPVDGVGDKLAAAIAILPKGGLFAFPSANAHALPENLRQEAAERGIELAPAYRLDELLAHLGVTIARTWLTEPFRGLEPFGFSHASIFFGREKEVAEIVELLALRSAILVRGPSGAGKSSLVLAGVLPALLRRNGGQHVTWGLFRPGDIVADPDPAREQNALARALFTAWSHDEPGGLGVAESEGISPGLDPEAFCGRLRSKGEIRAVLVVDQLEEAFDSRLHSATLDALAAFLADINDKGILLLATITNAAMPELNRTSRLAACFSVEGQFPLESRHDPALLEAVITAPAAAAGLRFEGGLQAKLIASASHGGADVLPLLELLLTELYERRDPAARELRIVDYRAVGGLDGVISARAESVFVQLTPAQKAAVPLLLWRLMTAGAIETSDFSADHPIHGLLMAYQTRRLLVRDQWQGKGATMRAAHEALLRHWSRAVEQHHIDESDIGLWRDLRHEARQSERGERALIPAGPQLEAARSLLHRRQSMWTRSDASIIDYIERSLRQNQRRRVLIGLGFGLPALAGAAWAGRSAWTAWRSLSETHIAFDDISVPGPDYTIAAEPYLHALGIAVTERSPPSARIVIRSNIGLYGGRAAVAGVGDHFLTEDIDDTTAPISFTLAFAKPPSRVGFDRAPLWAATESGVTHPAWTAEALDARGEVIDVVNEALLRGLPAGPDRLQLLDSEGRVKEFVGNTIPGQTYVLGAKRAREISSLRITSDYRLRGVPFAGVHAVLISELILFYD